MKYVDMTEALRQVRERQLNEISPSMRKFELEKQYKMILKDMPASEKNTEAGKIRAMDLARIIATRAPGMTMRDLKILQKNTGTLKLEETCPKCEGEACQCPQSETLEVTNADKMINSTAYQNYKSGDEHYHPAEDLEEQKRQLEEEIEILSNLKNTMIQEKIQQGFAVRFFDPSNGKRFAAAYPNKKDAQDKAAQLKKDGLKDISITQHTLNFKEDSLYEKLGYVVNYTDSKNKKFATAFNMKKDAENKSNQLKKSQMKDISITTHSINYNNQINFRGLDKPLSLHDKGEI